MADLTETEVCPLGIPVQGEVLFQALQGEGVGDLTCQNRIKSRLQNIGPGAASGPYLQLFRKMTADAITM